MGDYCTVGFRGEIWEWGHSYVPAPQKNMPRIIYYISYTICCLTAQLARANYSVFGKVSRHPAGHICPHTGLFRGRVGRLTTYLDYIPPLLNRGRDTPPPGLFDGSRGPWAISLFRREYNGQGVMCTRGRVFPSASILLCCPGNILILHTIYCMFY